MKTVYSDLHLHSRFSFSTSQRLTLDEIARCARIKGLGLVGTGDCLHKGWLEELEQGLSGGEKGFHYGEIGFILQCEVQTAGRIHHLVFFPNFGACHSLRDWIIKKGLSKNIDTNGRPILKLGGGELKEAVLEFGGCLGPAHAFTPYTSLYSSFHSLEDAYGGSTSGISFLELGLSADTSMANGMKELRELTFISSSDAHSAQPHRLGREFTALSVRSPCYKELTRLFEGKNGREVLLNVGLNPKGGKYYRSGCMKCKEIMGLKEIIKGSIDPLTRVVRRCPHCGGRIKLGVKDRAALMSDDGLDLVERPPYIHALPLAEIIQGISGLKSPQSTSIWKTFNEVIEAFGDEITVLIDADISEIEETNLKKDIGRKLATTIDHIRNHGVEYREEGHCGIYGKPFFDN